jgi:hypothetical protein
MNNYVKDFIQKNEPESSKFFTEKRRNRNNIREYIFNDLKKIEGE